MFHARWALAIATGCAVTPSGIRLAIAEVRAPLAHQLAAWHSLSAFRWRGSIKSREGVAL